MFYLLHSTLSPVGNSFIKKDKNHPQPPHIGLVISDISCFISQI